MKRFHLHLRTRDLAGARRFYSAMLGAEPTVVEADYLKWMLDDPRINLAISTREEGGSGVNHLGIQADSAAELEEIAERLRAARISTLEETGANCCYAQSDKHWASDPDGVIWETFHTHGARRTYGEDTAPDVERIRQAAKGGCCPGEQE